MSTGRFILLLLFVVALGLSILSWQRARMEKGGEGGWVSAKPADQTSDGQGPAHPPEPVSAELLRLRNEVSLLSKEFATPPAPPATQTSLPGPSVVEEWREIHSGPKPSDQAGFLAITNLVSAGQATPALAFQTLQFALRNQQNEKLTDTRMKELFDVPDDFDDPNARYAISLGTGIGGETGFRIVREQPISTNEVQLTIDFETRDGGAIRREEVLVLRGGKWRVKPASVKREP